MLPTISFERENLREHLRFFALTFFVLFRKKMKAILSGLSDKVATYLKANGTIQMTSFIDPVLFQWQRIKTDYYYKII